MSIHRAGFIAIAGLPNAGKSTLINRLAGFKISIVSPKPQTTRTSILAIDTEESHQAVFIDTPGILKPEYGLQKKMLNSALKAVREDADVLCLVTEAGVPPAGTDEFFQKIASAGIPAILAINKIDIACNEELIIKTTDYFGKLMSFRNILRISALAGTGVKELKQILIGMLPEHPAYYPDGEFTDHWMRFHAAELIREQIFNTYSQEIPYAVAVGIDEYSERADGTDMIHAALYVERESQKPMIIGRGGGAIKNLRERSEAEIGKMTGRKAVLSIRVKVADGWRNDPDFIRKISGE